VQNEAYIFNKLYTWGVSNMKNRVLPVQAPLEGIEMNDPKSANRILLHYHMLFSGGTSLFSALKQEFSPNEIQSISRFFGRWQIAKYKRTPNLKVIRQHYPININHFWGDSEIMTAIPIRNPISYILSTYNKPITYPGKIVAPYPATKQEPVEKYMESIRASSINNPTCRQICLLHPSLQNDSRNYIKYLKRDIKLHGYTSRDMMKCNFEEQMPYAAITKGLRDEEIFKLTEEVVKMKNFHIFPVNQMQEVVDSFIAPFLGIKIGRLSRVGKSEKKKMISQDEQDMILDCNSLDSLLFTSLNK